MSDKYYYKDGNVLGYRNWDKKLHKEDGPAIEYENGSKEWYINGKRHRVDGPAIKYATGCKEWWVDGKRHREDGPAIEWSNGEKWWFIDDRRLTEKEFNNKTQKTDKLYCFLPIYATALFTVDKPTNWDSMNKAEQDEYFLSHKSLSTDASLCHNCIDLTQTDYDVDMESLADEELEIYAIVEY